MHKFLWFKEMFFDSTKLSSDFEYKFIPSESELFWAIPKSEPIRKMFCTSFDEKQS